jgi:hypothetical protein
VAAGQHKGINAPRTLVRDHAQSGAGIATIVSKKEASTRELAAAHGNGALVKIDAAGHLDGMFEVVIASHVIGERQIAETSLGLGTSNRRIDCDCLVVSEKASEMQNLGDRLARTMPGK